MSDFVNKPATIAASLEQNDETGHWRIVLTISTNSVVLRIPSHQYNSLEAATRDHFALTESITTLFGGKSSSIVARGYGMTH